MASRPLRSSLLLGLAFSALAWAAFLQSRYDRRVDYFQDRDVFLSLPSSKTLKVLSFGLPHLTADLLYVWAIQFYATTQYRNRYDFLEPIFQRITDLSPQYLEAYLIGATIMVYEAQDVPMALRFLEKGSRQLPGEWRLDNDAGYYCFHMLKDFPRAEAYYLRASRNPGAPTFLRRLASHMYYLRGDPREAYATWLEIARQATDTLGRDSARNHLYQIKAEIDAATVRQAAQKFRDRTGRFPTGLDELHRRGYLTEVPRTFTGEEYTFDAKKGELVPPRVFRWKK